MDDEDMGRAWLRSPLEAGDTVIVSQASCLLRALSLPSSSSFFLSSFVLGCFRGRERGARRMDDEDLGGLGFGAARWKRAIR